MILVRTRENCSLTNILVIPLRVIIWVFHCISSAIPRGLFYKRTTSSIYVF